MFCIVWRVNLISLTGLLDNSSAGTDKMTPHDRPKMYEGNIAHGNL